MTWADGTVEPVTPSCPASPRRPTSPASRRSPCPAASPATACRSPARHGRPFDEATILQGRPRLRGGDRLDQPGAPDLRRRAPWPSRPRTRVFGLPHRRVEPEVRRLNLSSTIGRQAVGARWSMRPWESVRHRRSAGSIHAVHGPSEEGIADTGLMNCRRRTRSNATAGRTSDSGAWPGALRRQIAAPGLERYGAR